MSSIALIHCNLDYLNSIKELGLKHTYDEHELTIIVDDVPYTVTDGYYQDPDEQLCEHYGIDYDQVHCIEAA